MQVSNTLMSVSLVPGQSSINNADLLFNYLKNISDPTVLGPQYAILDTMRQSPVLAPSLRNLFDTAYHTGLVPPPLQNLANTPASGGGSTGGGTTPPNLEPIIRLYSDVMGQTLLGAMNAWQQQATIFHRLMREQMDDLLPQGENQKHEWGVITQFWSEQDNATLLRGESSPGYRYCPLLVTLGCDQTVDDWTFGIAGEFSHGTVECGTASFANTNIDALALGFYGGRFGETFYGKAVTQFGVGWNNVRSYYTSTSELDSAAYNSAILGTGLEFGARYQLGDTTAPWELTPHIGADYYFLTSAGFEEHGGPLVHSLSSCDENVVEVPIGLRLAKVIPLTAGPLGLNSLKPSVDMAYVRSVGDNVPVVAMHQVAMPDVVWNTNGNNIGRDIFRLTVGMAGQIGQHFTLGADYWLEDRDAFLSQQVNVNATYAW